MCRRLGPALNKEIVLSSWKSFSGSAKLLPGADLDIDRRYKKDAIVHVFRACLNGDRVNVAAHPVTIQEANEDTRLRRANAAAAEQGYSPLKSVPGVYYKIKVANSQNMVTVMDEPDKSGQGYQADFSLLNLGDAPIVIDFALIPSVSEAPVDFSRSLGGGSISLLAGQQKSVIRALTMKDWTLHTRVRNSLLQ